MNELFPSRRSLMNFNKGFLGDTFDDLFANIDHFSVDIKENEEAYTLKADLPGVSKEDIQLDYTDNVLAHTKKRKKTKKMMKATIFVVNVRLVPIAANLC